MVATYVVDGVLTMRPETFFTHLHFDHAGWAFASDVKTFPNARYAFAAQEWIPRAAGRLDEGEVAPRHVISQLSAGRTGFETFGDGDEIAPGVHALVTPGHTPGHTSYVITSQTGRRLLERLSDPGTYGFGCHFGDQPFGQVVVDAGGEATWVPIPSVVLAPPPR